MSAVIDLRFLPLSSLTAKSLVIDSTIDVDKGKMIFNMESSK